MALGTNAGRQEQISSTPSRLQATARGSDAAIGQIGQTNKAFGEAQRRGFESNVMPKDGKQSEMKQGSINKSTFTWNNIKVL